MSKTKYAPFDASEFLDNEETIAEYLAAALEDPNPDVFMRALAAVAKAKGVTDVARVSGLGRESLYKALAPGSKIRHETVVKVLNSFGVCFTVVPRPESRNGPASRRQTSIRKVVLEPQAEGPVAIWDGKPRRTSIEHDSVHDET